MKRLIFSGLVLGSLTYLIATQTHLLQAWTANDSPAANAQVSALQPAPNPFHSPAESITESITESINEVELLQELQASVSTLKAELAELTQTLQDSKNTVTESTIEAQRVLAASKVQSQEALPRQHITPDSAPLSPYMPLAERSNALMDLVQRMEMKAAAY